MEEHEALNESLRPFVGKLNVRPRIVCLLGALLLVTAVQASALDTRATGGAEVRTDLCPRLGRNAPAPVLVVPKLIRKGMRGAVILYKQLYIPVTVPCRKRAEAAIVDPAYLQGRVAKRDIFPGQQLTISQFSDPDKNEAVVVLAICPPGGELAPVQALVLKKLIRKGTHGSAILHQRLYIHHWLPCREGWKEAIVDPAYLQGRIAKRDIFVGQQLTRSQFSEL